MLFSKNSVHALAKGIKHLDKLNTLSNRNKLLACIKSIYKN